MSEFSLILVHGTFGGNEYAIKRSDSPQWNDADSDFCQFLRKEFPEEQMAFQNPVFDWRGKNLESERLHGAAKLAETLVEFENIGKPYHLIGHSHGGSVIWAALRLVQQNCIRKRIDSAETGKKDPALRHLRSWTTVGTPFLISKSSFLSEFRSIIYQVFIIVGASLLLLWGLELGLHEFMPEREAQVMDWAAKIVMFLGFVMVLSVTGYFVRAVLQTWTEGLRFTNAERSYLGLWCGLMSKDDEALNGLKAAQRLDAKILSKTESHALPHIPSTMMKLRRTLYSPLNFIRNSLVLRLGNRLIRDKIRDAALGDNAPLTRVKGIHNVPIECDDLELLPEKIEKQLHSAADQALASAVPRLRSSLSQAVTSAGRSEEDYGFDIPAETFCGSELIHTSYFDNLDVRKFIAAHIRISQSDSAAKGDPVDWIKKKKAEVQKLIEGRQFIRWPLVAVRVLAVVLIILLLLAVWFYPQYCVDCKWQLGPHLFLDGGP